jgi:hypothetical protein
VNESSDGKVPVLFLVHARPGTTAAVFQKIREYAPPRLYVVADGPRHHVEGEAELVVAVRDVVTAVDWNCEIHTLFRDSNFGCGKSVNGGLDWFFSQEELGIILEDDTVPHPSFFQFCETLLYRYAEDDRIGMISGHVRPLSGDDSGESYFFLSYCSVWGWASWSRAWKSMDYDMKWRQQGVTGEVISWRSATNRGRKYWFWVLDLLDSEKVDSWAYRWQFSLAFKKYLCIVPRSNLVDNIGFGRGATHTARKPGGPLTEAGALETDLRHPKAVELDRKRLAELEKYLPDRRTLTLVRKKFKSLFYERVLDPMYRLQIFLRKNYISR